MFFSIFDCMRLSANAYGISLQPKLRLMIIETEHLIIRIFQEKDTQQIFAKYPIRVPGPLVSGERLCLWAFLQSRDPPSGARRRRARRTIWALVMSRYLRKLDNDLMRLASNQCRWAVFGASCVMISDYLFPAAAHRPVTALWRMATCGLKRLCEL